MNSSQTLSGAVNSQHRVDFIQSQSQSQSQSRLDSMGHIPDIRVLQSRSRYKTCHICVSGMPQWLPAIEVDGSYYSFFRVLKSQPEALQASYRLSQQGDRPIVTQIPKGYAVWVLEPDVVTEFQSASAQSSGVRSSTGLRSSSSISEAALGESKLPEPAQDKSFVPALDAPSTKEELMYRVLTSQRQYSKHRVRLPGLDQTVLAVQFEKKFYSLFKTSHSIQQIAQIVKKISRRGDKTVVTRMPQGYGVWILEPQAIPVDPLS